MSVIESKTPTKEECKSGVRTKHRYIPCPHTDKRCQWNMGKMGNGLGWMSGTCYLSGSFELQCDKSR